MELYSISCKTYNVRECKNILYIYIYIKLNHFAIYLKLIQHCKLQFNQKF